MKSEVIGMKELLKYVGDLEKLPQRVVTKSAKQGAAIALASARQNAPKGKTGNLRKGITLKGEKSRAQGKKVYQVTFNEKYNDKFVKLTKAGKRYYYPASQEYGFRTIDGGRVEGKHFMKEALTDNAQQIDKTIIDELIKEIDKLK